MGILILHEKSQFYSCSFSIGFNKCFLLFTPPHSVNLNIWLLYFLYNIYSSQYFKPTYEIWSDLSNIFKFNYWIYLIIALIDLFIAIKLSKFDTFLYAVLCDFSALACKIWDKFSNRDMFFNVSFVYWHQDKYYIKVTFFSCSFSCQILLTFNEWNYDFWWWCDHPPPTQGFRHLQLTQAE